MKEQKLTGKLPEPIQAAKRQKAEEMEEGYKAITKEQKQFAAMAAKIEHEVLPEWE